VDETPQAATGRAGTATGPHLVFLGHGAERTGPPILLGHLLRGLGRAGGHRLTVLTARPGPLLDDYRRSGATAEAASRGREPLEPLAAALRRVGAPGLVGPLQARARSRATRRATGADLVYVNAATPPTAALLRALDPPAHVPVLVHVHELDIGLRMTLDPADLRLLLDRADHLIGASDAVTTLLVEGHGVAADRITTCAEFVDTDLVRPLPRAEARDAAGIPHEALVIGSVGLPDWRKDPERLLHAVVHLHGTHPDLDPWVLWVGGDPESDDGRKLADEARRVGLRDRFVHLPHRDRPDHLLGAFDVFALPAREDALPLATLEAAAAGVPLVCFRTGGTAGLCDAGAGIAVDHPDVAAFAGALADLLADPVRRAEVGRAGAAVVAEHHSRDIGVDRIRQVIDRALGDAHRPDRPR
jgi:glycosyltransferase involved in cell wall biosynthesis